MAASIATQAPAARLRFVVLANATGKIGAEIVSLVEKNMLSDPLTGLTDN